MVAERVGFAADSFKFSHPDVIGPHCVAGREHGPLRPWLRISSVLASSAIELQSWTLPCARELGECTATDLAVYRHRRGQNTPLVCCLKRGGMCSQPIVLTGDTVVPGTGSRQLVNKFRPPPIPAATV